ncbi:DNA-directed DNA polymerase [Liquorilactobacillus oeni DSM 19972]|uniref:DNA-directed DNA polymerase n=1 Tax=Liquorilactobacillus oeni DSM 19972 TaxID=1423777 RepID=A0A0R1MKU8_9LACO|nr:DNA-directed DNA polymerase [Liquorilactobacillus oeni DSM 19972]
MTNVWGIGKKTAEHLKHLHIHNMYELAHANPYLLKEKMGVIGSQLFAVSWGVDRSRMNYRPITKSASIGNSQVLPHDYKRQAEIETVIKEIGKQVAARLRHHNKLANCLSLAIGFSYAAAAEDGRNGFHQAVKINPSNSDHEIANQLIFLFRKNWEGQAVRNIAVYSSKLVFNTGQQLNLFLDPVRQVKNEKLNYVIDEIHKRFGFAKLVYATSLTKGGTAIERAKLVGGHNGGNSYE